MSTTLRDFLATRRAEIKAQITALRAEQRELDAAAAAIDAAEGGGSGKTHGQSSISIKDMALFVLRDCRDGADANEVLALIKTRFGQDIPRTSLSPQLSRLKSDELITLSGKNWHLTGKGLDAAMAISHPTTNETAPDNESGAA